jgi:hypothetical protein
MDIKKARLSLYEMLDLCSRLEDDTLSEASSGIYNDTKAAKTVEQIIDSARELMVFVNEASWEDSEFFELKEEIETIYNTLLEDYEEF